jgi:hypothetical protein
MFLNKVSRILRRPGTIAAGLSIWAPTAALSGSPSAVEDRAIYQPVQSISYDFGSKSMSGYFLSQFATCLVTLMVLERGDPEKPLPPSATRLRLIMYPGQIAGLDSEEGRSLNFTCGKDATTLLVDIGARDRLVVLQNLAARAAAANAE